MIIQFPVILDGLKMNKDKSLTIKLESREMTSEEVGKIADLANCECWCGLSALTITKLDVPDEVPEFKGEKTPSERLRNVLYIYWKEVNKGQGSFETFRNNYMEKIISSIKEKLPNDKE
jgi:hypothetical protein